MTKKVTIRGVTYPSIKAAAEAYGVRYGTVWMRVRSAGLTLEDAIRCKVGGYHRGPYVVRGVTYATFKEAAAAHGINVNTARHRFSVAGMPIDYAFTLRPAPRERQPVTVQGVSYPSIRAACRAFGRSYSTAARRIENGWTAEEAITQDGDLRFRGCAVAVDGKEYPSIRAACRALGLSASAVCTRLKSGQSVEEAFRPVAHYYIERRKKEAV